MKRKVKITKLAGHTGLLRVGTVLTVPKAKAEGWIKLGIAEYLKKEKKSKPKTKELKSKIETKSK